MAPLRISFLLRAVYDLLPSKSNLVKWGAIEDAACPLCQERQTVEHVLSSCKTALSQGRYTWRHNQVLSKLAEIVSSANGKMVSSVASEPLFLTEGGSKSWIGKKELNLNHYKRGLLDGAYDWSFSADLPEWENHPDPIKKSGMRPDMVLFSTTSKQIIMIELTVPYESRIDSAHIYKTENYRDLGRDLEKLGFKVKVIAVEIGARGFIGASVYNLIKELSIGGNQRNKALKTLAETAEKCSCWIWARRNEMMLYK